MAEEKRPEWMTSISSLVDPDEYLLGRKIDKTFELSQKEKADKAREARIELLAKDKIKLNHDPILDLERRKQQLKMELVKNPVMMKQFRDKLLKGEHSGNRDSSGNRDQRGHSDQRTDQKPSGERDHRSDRHSSGGHDHRSSRHTRDDRSRSRDRDHYDYRARRDYHSHRSRSDRESRDRDHRPSDSRSGVDRSKDLGPPIMPVSRHRKGKVHVLGEKPEMPAFLQRIKMQVVENEDAERRLKSEKKRRERSGAPTNEEDEPAVVKLGDDDLTEAEYKRLKRELETQYKIPDGDKADVKRASEDLDIDQIIKSDRSLVGREGQEPSTSRSHGHRSGHSSKDSRDRNSSSHEPLRDKSTSRHQKVLSYGSSSDDND